MPDYSRHRIIQTGLRSLGVSVLETRDRSIMPLRWWRLARAVHSAPSDVPIIVGEASNFLFPILLEARLQDHPVVFDVFVPVRDAVQDESEDWRSRLLGPLLGFIDRFNNWAAATVVLDTHQSRKYFIEHLGLQPEKAYVAYVGAETDLFYPRPNSVKSSGQLKVLFYGSYLLLHGIDVIIRAAALIQDTRRDIRFQLVGDGPVRREMQILADRLRVSNIDYLHGYIPYHQLPDLIASADLCLGIFADRPKTMRVIPNKLYQCAAMGLPVITADTPAIREGFSEGEIELVPAGDPQALSQAILALADDARRCESIGQAGMKAVRERYNPRSIALQFLEACWSSYG